jgi:hypothetical protein
MDNGRRDVPSTSIQKTEWSFLNENRPVRYCQFRDFQVIILAQCDELIYPLKGIDDLESAAPKAAIRASQLRDNVERLTTFELVRSLRFSTKASLCVAVRW